MPRWQWSREPGMGTTWCLSLTGDVWRAGQGLQVDSASIWGRKPGEQRRHLRSQSGACISCFNPFSCHLPAARTRANDPPPPSICIFVRVKEQATAIAADRMGDQVSPGAAHSRCSVSSAHQFSQSYLQPVKAPGEEGTSPHSSELPGSAQVPRTWWAPSS